MTSLLSKCDKLKEKGNALFKSGKFNDALTVYSQAISEIEAILLDGGGSDVRYKHAVLISNKSNFYSRLVNTMSR